MQLGINNQILILGPQKEKTCLRKAARGLKMGAKPGHKPTNTRDDSKLPTPDSDPCPNFTKFINDIGELYVKSSDWSKHSGAYERAYREKTLNKVIHYLSDSFITILRRELNLD